jgi:phosphoglycerate-specific signal transduction histidine kinase
MLGFTDGWIALVYIFCICSTLLCVIYGVVNWNKGFQNEEKQVAEVKDTRVPKEKPAVKEPKAEPKAEHKAVKKEDKPEKAEKESKTPKEAKPKKEKKS